MLRARLEGKRRDIGLGSLKVLSLAEARAKALQMEEAWMVSGSLLDPFATAQFANFGSKRTLRSMARFEPS